jgi:SagB-type dehydrogenase family enzyme
MTAHFLDWDNQPSVYKTYPNVEHIQLPRNVQFPEETLSSLFGRDPARKDSPGALDIYELSRIFLLTYSHTAKSGHGGRGFYYRSVASAGALYPTEIYVAANGVSGVHNGLYHFSLASHGLSLLRKGDLSLPVIEAGQLASGKPSNLVFFFSTIFFRSAWKYRERSYRYHLLDTGHLVENAILALKSLALPFALSYDFDDHAVNRLLGLDDTKEASLAIISVPGSHEWLERRIKEIEDLPNAMKEASRMAEREVPYPAVQEMHRAGVKIASRPKSEPQMMSELGVIPGQWTQISPPETWPESARYAESVFRRRSRRNFVLEPISLDCLAALIEGLRLAGSGTAEGVYKYFSTICTGMLVGKAVGLGPGFYMQDASTGSVGRVCGGFFMDSMAHICLDQAWLSNAVVQFLFMTNLKTLDRKWGARGYRYAMMAAGRMGERLYLSATAMGLGCCGIGAFYDDEAAELLGINRESQLLYLVAVGPVRSEKAHRHTLGE